MFKGCDSCFEVVPVGIGASHIFVDAGWLAYTGLREGGRERDLDISAVPYS